MIIDLILCEKLLDCSDELRGRWLGKIFDLVFYVKVVSSSTKSFDYIPEET